jgi:tetratricopeptide (TPR) repeat protein
MRLKMTILIAGLMLIGAAVFVTVAQDETPAEPDTPTMAQLEQMVEQAESAAERAELAAAEAEIAVERADNSLNLANNMFGLFEAMSGAIGLVVPILVVVAGVLGFRRLENANTELREAREKFERELEQRNVQLDALNRELEETARKQREEAARSSLALALLQLGERQFKAQDYQGALDTYSRALSLDSQNPITHYRMAYVFVHSDRFEEAEYHLERSLELDPQFMPAVATRGYVFRRMGDRMQPGLEQDIMYNRAEENFLAALKVYPKLIDEDGESWWGSLGGLYRRRGQIDQAIYAYEQCAAAVPRSSYAYSNLALLYGQKQQIDKMIETYGKVEKLAWGEIQADVDNYWAYADLVTARIAQGKVEETWAILDTAINTAPIDSPYTLNILVDTLERLKKTLGPDSAERIEPVIEHIKTFATTRYGDEDARVTVEDVEVLIEGNVTADTDGSEPDDTGAEIDRDGNA